MTEIERQVGELTSEVRSGFADLNRRLDERFSDTGPCVTHGREIGRLWAAIRWLIGLVLAAAFGMLWRR